MTRTASLAALVLLLVACGAGTPKAVPRDVALKELPTPDEVAFIEIQVGANSPAKHIEDPKIIAAALAFLEHDVDGWTVSTETPISVDGIFAGFVGKSTRDKCAFFVDYEPARIVVSCSSSVDVFPGIAAVDRFKSILGLR